MKLHEHIAATLRRLGVEVVFGLVGDANLYMMDSFQRRGGRYVPVANESGALLAAAGHASISGTVGVASVTHGPGLANTVTSLYEAVKHRVPAVLIAGDTAANDTDNFQDIDQRALVVATGARFVAARSAQSIAADLGQAFREAREHRTAVVFNVPIDLQWQDVSGAVTVPPPVPPGIVHPAADGVEAAVGALAAARRPLILAGRGAFDAADVLLQLADRLGAPVATTAQARQLFRGSPVELGIFGGLATPAALEVILESDCIVAFGAGLNRWTTAEGSLVRGRTVIQVDSDAAAIGRHVPDAIGVHGDSRVVAEAVIALLDEAQIPASAFAGDQLKQRLADGRVAVERERQLRRTREVERERTQQRPAGTVDLLVAQWALEAAFPMPRTVVMDAGRQCMTGLGIFTVADPRHYVHTISFGSIGVGLPYAIGAALAAPSRPALLLCGDGGFMLGGITEFNTAVRLGLDLVVAVFNDQSFGAEHVQLVRKGLDPAISNFAWPDLGAVADSLGGTGITIRSIAELDAALAGLPQRTGVVLLNISISADELSRAA